MDGLIARLGDKCAAVGECGLDYDRLEFSSKEVQNKYLCANERVFPMHFDLAQNYQLPMYLHSRNCKDDFVKIVRANRHKFNTACVHSYTGDLDELQQLLAMDLYIGINGCSLKTIENIEVMKKIPLDRLMLESNNHGNYS